MNSLEIRETKLKLVDIVNKIELPLEVKRMMLAEVMIELEKATTTEINALLSERQEKKEHKKKEED